jgi:hypothetical protein
MKKTIKQLEDQIAYLKTQSLIDQTEIVRLKAINDAYKLNTMHIPVITIALERVTDVVAHVLTDLKEISRRKGAI